MQGLLQELGNAGGIANSRAYLGVQEYQSDSISRSPRPPCRCLAVVGWLLAASGRPVLLDKSALRYLFAPPQTSSLTAPGAFWCDCRPLRRTFQPSYASVRRHTFQKLSKMGREKLLKNGIQTVVPDRFRKQLITERREWFGILPVRVAQHLAIDIQQALIFLQAFFFDWPRSP